MRGITGLGCKLTADRDTKNKTRITNSLAITTSVSCIGVVAILLNIEGPSLSALIVGAVVILMWIPVIINAMGKHLTARRVYIILANFIVLSLAMCFGREGQFHYYFYVLVGMPLIFFSKSSHRMKWAYSSIAIVAWILAEIALNNSEPWVAIADDIHILFRYINNSLLFVFITAMLYFFVTESDQFVSDLKQERKKLIAFNDKLDIALDKANAATKAKSMFLANMSHEIRTPLNGIIVASDLLRESQLNSNQRELSEIVHTSSQSLMNIVNDVLDFSKAEANKSELNETVFSLNDMIDETVAAFSHMINEKGLQMVVDATDEVRGEYIGDRQKLKQIITNLIGNALKFCETGYVKIHIEQLMCLTNGESTLQFRVKDSGIGIAPEKIGSIFDSFTQEDGSTSRTYGGTGLGTTISKMFVELMGGEIHAQSPNPWNKDNKSPGSVFTFTVKLRQTENEAPFIVQHDLKGQRCILAVKSNVTTRYLRDLLLRWNVDVCSCESSAEVTSVLENGPFDFIITDGHFHTAVELPCSIKQIVIHTNLQTSASLKDNCNVSSLRKPFNSVDVFQALTHQAGETTDENESYELMVFNPEAFKGLRVLLAEDNIINQQVAIQLFASLGCTLDIAEDGLECIDKMEKGEYDLIFMDHMMPNMDGLEATVALRSKGIDLPIIAMTANTVHSDRIKYKEAGMNDYISKPVIKEKLIEVLERWVSA